MTPSRRRAALPPARPDRFWIVETTWPYGLLLAAMLFGIGLLALGIALQALFTAGEDRGAVLERWIPTRPGRPAPPIPREPAEAGTVEQLQALFATRGYDLGEGAAEGAPIPPIALQRLPSDLAALPDPAERKRLFLQSVLPLVLMANFSVRRVRQQLLELEARLDSGEVANPDEARWLSELARLHGLSVQRGRALAPSALLARIDEVPVAIALAQAALETGWGTSRFAREGNALFGARTWRSDMDGLVPLQRADGERFRVRSFDEPAQSVFSYLHNLNSSPAYADWRARRAELRQSGAPLRAAALLEGLSRYSEAGADYVALLETLIETEDLERLAPARLASGGPERLEAAAGPRPSETGFLLMP